MIGSCNGLILVGRTTDPHSICIRKSLVIPAYPFSPSLHANAVYLFGYASVSKDYKVVALANEKGVSERTQKMYVAVYTLRDQQWTARNDWLNVGIPNAIEMSRPYYCLSAAVFLKGVAYWLGHVDKNRNELTLFVPLTLIRKKLPLWNCHLVGTKEAHVGFCFFLGNH